MHKDEAEPLPPSPASVAACIPRNVEPMEQICLLSDFTMLSITQTNGTTVSFDYQVQQANIASLALDFYMRGQTQLQFSR